MRGSSVDQLRDLKRCSGIWQSVANGSRPLDDALSRIADIVQRQVGASETVGTLALQRGLICRWEGRRTIECTVGLGTAEEQFLARMRQMRPPRRIVDVQRAGGTIYAGYAPSKATLRSELTLPLWQSGVVVGFVDIGSTAPGAFEEGDALWLELVMEGLSDLPWQERESDLGTRLGSDLASERDIELVLDKILRCALDMLDMTKLSDAYAAILIDDGDQVVPRFAIQATEAGRAPTQPVGKPGWSKMLGLTGRALRTGAIQVVPNVEHAPDYLRHLPKTRSEVVIPVRAGKNQAVIGLLDLQAPEYEAFPPEVVAQLETLTEQVSLALYTAHLSETVVREQRVLDQLAEVASSTAGPLNPQHLYEVILKAVRKLLPDVSLCQLLLVKLDNTTGQSILVVECALPHAASESYGQQTQVGLVGLRHSVDRGLTGQAVRTQRTHYVPDVQTLTAEGYIKISEQTRSELAIPLTLGSEVIAVLNIESDVVDAFSPRDRQVAELLASQAGFAISKAQDYGRRLRWMKNVTDATRKLAAAAGDREALVGAILDGAMRVTKAEDGYCALLLLEGDVLKVGQERYFYPLPERKMEWPVTRRLSGLAVRKKRTIYQPDVRGDPDSIVGPPNMRSSLVVPLLNGEKQPVGALSLESPLIDAFDEQAQHELERFGELVVIALMNAELVSGLREQQRATAERITQVAHLLGTPVLVLQDRLRELAVNGTSAASAKQIEAATAFLDVLLSWLQVQTSESVDAGQTPYERVNVYDLVENVLQGYRFYATLRSVELSLVPPPDTSMEAEVYRGELMAALVELLANAVKYSPEHGEVKVTMRHFLRSIEITVEDQGMRVPAAERERIFERGVRGSKTNEVRGGGLGLYFVRKAMDRLGGDAFVEPRSGRSSGEAQGNRFVLRLPASSAARRLLPVVSAR